ncbi:MAG: peptidylprolyl isomerase [Bacillota bacterium]|nr:peptidylprolyl isomerase [Bacillota bacterium]
MKRILAFSLAVIMLLACMTGCSSKPSYKEDTVMTVNGVEISWDEYMFWIGYAAMYLNYQYSMYGMELDWSAEVQEGMTAAQWCVDYAQKTIVQKAVIDAKCAEMEITLNEDEQAEVQKSLDDYKAQCCGEDATDDQFEAYLKTNEYSNISVLRSSQTTTALTNKLFDKLYGEDNSKVDGNELLALAEENGYTKANHILFLFTDENGEARSDAEKAAGKAKLEGFMEELNAIEDKEARYARFLELKEENCEDTGTEAYQFAAGTMVEEFYNKSLELGEYEMDIVETTYGYHLMIGLPLDLDYSVTGGANQEPLSLRETMVNKMFTDQLEQWQNEAEVKMIGEFEDFDFTSVFGPSGFIYQSWADRAAAKKK